MGAAGLLTIRRYEYTESTRIRTISYRELKSAVCISGGQFGRRSRICIATMDNGKLPSGPFPAILSSNNEPCLVHAYASKYCHYLSLCGLRLRQSQRAAHDSHRARRLPAMGPLASAAYRSAGVHAQHL